MTKTERIFTKSEPAIDETVVQFPSEEALRWFYLQFQKYCRNDLDWIEVRSVMATIQEWMKQHNLEPHEYVGRVKRYEEIPPNPHSKAYVQPYENLNDGTTEQTGKIENG